MNAEMAMVVKRNEEREALRSIIQQWNANRLDMFELSEPNEDLDFHGVMRFYFQDSGQKVATKCIRVASDATAQHVIETLIEKFRPDMRMLSLPEYALFEIHENGEERRLGMDEKPLLVQLNWHKDDREGRFLLRRINDKTTTIPHSRSLHDGAGSGSSFRRKLSKREKKQLKKQEKMNRLKSSSDINNEDDAKVAEKLYTELPETSFTRSISNPEAVMRRRRQQKLEGKLQEFRSKDGGPDTGGTLKIYGESLCRDVPYKTLLLSVKDTAQQVVREMLLKYGLDKEDPHNYCLVQVNSDYDTNTIQKDGQLLSNNVDSNSINNINNAGVKNNNVANNNNSSINGQEYILDDDECPLTILMSQRQSQGSIMFHVRRRPADYHPRKRKKKPQQKWNHQVSNELLEYRYEDGLDRLPLLLELNPDGSEIVGGAPKRHRLHLNVTEVGCERINGPGQSQYLQLLGPNIQPRHCVIANTEGIVTVTPCSRDAETYVNNQRIYETTILQNGATVKFGRIHCFRFLDPCYEDRIRQRHDSARNVNDYVYESRQTLREDNSSITTTETQRISSSQNNVVEPAQTSAAHNYETTFDVDGNVETRSTSSQGNKDDTRSQRSVGSISRDGNRLPNAGYPRGGTDPILPAVLEIREETEEALLHALITDLDPATPSFKLAPAYCLYLMARYRASTHYRPELTPTERAHRLTLMLARVSSIIHAVIQERYCDKKSLALWLANSSELLNFLKSDRHISAFSVDAQDTLADSVQLSFRYMVSCIQSELSSVMPHFFVDKDDPSHDAEDSPIAPVLAVLSSVMGLLRRCRVNAALTIQLFSQLFYFINVWGFNRLVASNTNYCSRIWGLRLKARLAQIEVWAERQGLELAADCHLARIVQAAHLLQAPKYTAEDLASLTSTCFKLNSLQLRSLLTKYQLVPDEPKLPHDLIENVVRVAENLADELARSDCREVRLEEESELALPFLLPEDGYSCEVVRGIPQGLIEFVSPLQHAGLCRLSSQPSSNGSWTVYMGHATLPTNTMVRSPSAMSNRSTAYQSSGQQEPEIHTIKLHKSNNGMGLSIVAAKGAGQDKLGIYIKSVVKGGAADADGRLQAGDQLLKVDGQSLVGITQEKAAEYLVRTGPIVTLEVAKQGAIYHGLATLLSQPSPVLSRGGRRISERDLPSRVQNEQQHNHPNSQLLMHSSQIHSSKSVPTLNSTGVSDNQIVSPSLGSRSHEVFNPGYSRTSSTNSIHQRQTEQLHQSNAAHRSRSTQNLNDMRTTLNYPSSHTSRLHPNYSTNSPNMQSAQQVSTGHHPQTIPQYQHSPGYQYNTLQPPTHHPQQHQQQHPMYLQHVQQQQQILLQQQQQQQQYPHPMNNSNNISNNSGNINNNTSADNNGERFYQNLSIYRNQDMQNGYVSDNLNNSATLHNGGKILSPQYDRSTNNQFQRSFRGSQTSLQQTPPNRLSNDFLPPHLKERPASAYLQKENYPPPAPGMSNRSYSTRDMIRQEAKLQEIGEEVRRREIREKRNLQPEQQQHYSGSPSRIKPPAGSPGQHSQYVVQQKAPHPQPINVMNSYAVDNQFSPSASYNSNAGNNQMYNPKLPLRAAVADELSYRESPPPPPPPPTSTHPLYQPNDSNSNQRSPDNRYTASVGEPPKGGYYPPSPVTSSSSTKHYPLQGTNPWEREEREKEAERRREVAKEWRDQQIMELLALGPNRNPSQEEQLRALKLEKEFERRVQEDDDDEEDDQETIERVQDVMRTAQQQDRLHNTSIISSASNNLNKTTTVAAPSRIPSSTNISYSHMNGTLNKSGLTTNAALEERERLRRLKDLKMKQAELDAMRAEEQRAKQKDQDIRFQNSAHFNSNTGSSTNVGTKRPSHLRLDNLVNNASTTSYGSHNTSGSGTNYPYGNNSLMDYSNSSVNSTLNQQAPQQRLDNLLLEQTLPPSPPERGSSSFVNSSSSSHYTSARNQMSGSSLNVTSKNDLSLQPNTNTLGPKKVSFQDSSTTVTNSVNVTPQQEKVNEDPNRFIYEAETMLASPKSPDITFAGTTPGVIGTQEVYKDPRQRRLAEQQQKSLTNKLGPVPEKLTFKEKIKMFAMETGEEGTPKDKVKISRAQRDIDNLNSSGGTQVGSNGNNYATNTTNE